MPKIAIATQGSGHKVTEPGKALPADSVNMSRRPGQVEVRILLDQLGQPEKIFFTAEARAGKARWICCPGSCWTWARLCNE
jgi:hypothetical protein